MPDQPDLAPVVGAPVRSSWGDLPLRIASAAVLAPLALWSIWTGGAAWAVLIAVAAVGLIVEWLQLCRERLTGAAGGIAVAAVLAAALAALSGRTLSALVILLLGAGTSALTGARAVLAGGVLYVGLPCLALVWLRAGAPAGRANMLLLVLVVWATDIGAYVAGRLIGGARLAPRISPGKTWSGAAGGLLAAILVGWTASPRAAGVAAALSVVAQFGDLLESLLKRRFGVKDSGWLIPGHGGLLDRLDGVLAAALLAAALAYGGGLGELLWR